MISVTADAIVCGIGNVDITTHSCKLTFGAKILGRQRQYAAHMSAYGTKQTLEKLRSISAFGGKADITQTSENVRL